MLIAIDGVAACDPNRVGVGVYTFELLKYFSRHASSELEFNVYLKSSPLPDMPKESSYFHYRMVPGPFLWSRLFFPLALWRDEKPDVFFAPAHYLPPYFPGRAVVTIHDLAYEYFAGEFLKKDLYKLKNWTRSAVQKVSVVIAVSENTKRDLVKLYNVPAEKVSVIYNGFTRKDSGVADASQNGKILAKYKNNSELSILNSKFVLYVGTLQPRKNIPTLIEAFDKLQTTHPELKLVIVGKKGWLYESIFEKVKELGLKDKVVFTGYIDDLSLSVLYKQASMLVLPSLYEGFGIPVLEAMSADCPVLAAQNSSLPEVGGSAALYFDPKDSAQLAQKIDMILKDSKLRQELIKKGQEQAKKFSWEKCGKQTLEILSSSAL